MFLSSFYRFILLSKSYEIIQKNIFRSRELRKKNSIKRIFINPFAVGDMNSWRLGCIEENDHETAVWIELNLTPSANKEAVTVSSVDSSWRKTPQILIKSLDLSRINWMNVERKTITEENTHGTRKAIIKMFKTASIGDETKSHFTVWPIYYNNRFSELLSINIKILFSAII